MKTSPPSHIYLRILVVSLFIALLGLSPSPHAVGTLLTRAYQSANTGEPLAAASDLENVVEYFPWRVELIIASARYAFQAGDPEPAIQYFERPEIVTHLTTDDLILLGDAYHQSGNTSRAEVIWKELVEQRDSYPACQRLIDLYIQRKDYPAAVIYLQKSLSFNPSDPQPYYRIGLLYAATDPIKSLPFLAQAAEIDPTIEQVAQSLHDKIRTATAFDQPAYTLLASGRELANMGEWTLAAEAFKSATDEKPDYADAWAFLGEAQQQIIKQEKGTDSGAGLPELQRAVQLDPNSILANTFMGLYWERQQDYSQAQQYIEKAITASPDDSYLYSELGNILSKMGDLPAAQAAYQAAIQLTPQDPLFYRLLAQFALDNQIQTRELALPAARQALILDPDDPDSLDVMAQVMLMLEDYESAERYSLAALESDPGFAPAYLHLGTAYLYLNQPELALHWLGVASKVDADSWVAAQASRMIEFYFP